MPVDLRGVRAVLLPGTGSDDDYVYRAFSGALEAAGAVLIAAKPDPEQLVSGYVAVLDGAACEGPIVVGGVSIGAAVATTWALAHPDDAVAVLAALPAWTGAPDDAPAAVSARQTAFVLRRDGLAAASADLRATTPRWLGDELTRSWAGQWPGLPSAMEEAASFVAPTEEELAHLLVPMGIGAAVDDPIHPLDVALRWAAAAPVAAMRTVMLDELGADPGCLGAACMAALQQA
jgi:pimeloyl-ACP methyl ester carboxylesterase